MSDTVGNGLRPNDRVSVSLPPIQPLAAGIILPPAAIHSHPIFVIIFQNDVYFRYGRAGLALPDNFPAHLDANGRRPAASPRAGYDPMGQIEKGEVSGGSLRRRPFALLVQPVCRNLLQLVVGESGVGDGRITMHDNGWCSAAPVAIEQYGWRGSDPVYSMFYDPEAVLDGVDYYVYYQAEYVGIEVNQLQGMNPERRQWEFTITPQWAKANSGWDDPIR